MAPPADNDTTTSEARPFAAVLHDLSRGRTHAELTRRLTDLIQAVQDTGKPGTLTLALKVTPRADHVVELTDVITVKAPSASRGASMFYVDDSGQLSRSDPRQPTLDQFGA